MPKEEDGVLLVAPDMPKFRCLGKDFSLSAADLERAPHSVLTGAWEASSGEEAVSLSSWPDPDLDYLEVCPWQLPEPIRVAAWLDTHSIGMAHETMPYICQVPGLMIALVQVVLKSLNSEPYPYCRKLDKAKAIRVLDYFAVPQSAWPHGLQLLHTAQQSFKLWNGRDQVIARSMLRQIRDLMEVPSVEACPRPDCSKLEEVTVRQTFQVEIFDPARNLYILGEGQQLKYHAKFPAFAKGLEAAIVEAGKQECLNITVHRFEIDGPQKRVSRAVTIYVAASPFSLPKWGAADVWFQDVIGGRLSWDEGHDPGLPLARQRQRSRTCQDVHIVSTRHVIWQELPFIHVVGTTTAVLMKWYLDAS